MANGHTDFQCKFILDKCAILPCDKSMSWSIYLVLCPVFIMYNISSIFLKQRLGFQAFSSDSMKKYDILFSA